MIVLVFILLSVNKLLLGESRHSICSTVFFSDFQSVNCFLRKRESVRIVLLEHLQPSHQRYIIIWYFFVFRYWLSVMQTTFTATFGIVQIELYLFRHTLESFTGKHLRVHPHSSSSTDYQAQICVYSYVVTYAQLSCPLQLLWLCSFSVLSGSMVFMLAKVTQVLSDRSPFST